MLDDISKIAELDKSHALDVVADQPKQLLQQFDVDLSHIKEVKNIVVAGMGGSALAAEFIKCWLGDRLPVPLVIVRDYGLPAFVGSETLAIISSYSGNTEETLSAFEEAKKRSAQIVTISAGAKLKQLAEDQGLPYIGIPSGIQPRLAVLYGVKALAALLETLGLVKDLVSELEQACDWVHKETNVWKSDVGAQENQAKQIAQQIHGSPAVVYASPTLNFLAMKWKIDLNENAKNVAFYNVFPEFNHNEFIGWLNAGKNLTVIELQSNLDRPEIQKRFEVSNKLLAEHWPAPIIVEAKGESKLEQMLWTFELGGFVSAYLAFLNGVDPTPVDLVEKLKQELA